MPLRLIQSAIEEARMAGDAVCEVDADALTVTGLLEPLVEALAQAGLRVRLAAQPAVLRVLRLAHRVPIAGALVRADASIRGGTLRLTLSCPRAAAASGARASDGRAAAGARRLQ